MPTPPPFLGARHPLVVGTCGSEEDLHALSAEGIGGSCDIVEIRLDLLAGPSLRPWRHLNSLPLLFTARRRAEGGGRDLAADSRAALLQSALSDAALLDIEVASIDRMQPLIDELGGHRTPWIASFHDFGGVPPLSLLERHADTALAAGASAFKAAVRLERDPSPLQGLCGFLAEEHGLPISLMGMGPLAPVSRLLFAQCGSVLNYGFLGDTPTAPGQWSARLLREAIQALEPFTQ